MTSPDLQNLADNFRSPAFPASVFISFEGIEGAGKSTQILRTQRYLESQGAQGSHPCGNPAEPPLGKNYARLSCPPRMNSTPWRKCTCLPALAPKLLSKVTLQELAVPQTAIIYDRYLDSTLAYQGYGAEVDAATILQTHQYFPLNLVPHLTFYLEIDVETSLLRQRQRNLPQDYFESRGEKFYKKVLAGYQFACDLFPHRISRIQDDGNASEEDIFDRIRPLLDNLLETL